MAVKRKLPCSKIITVYRGIRVIHKITSFTFNHKLLPKHCVSATFLILHALTATYVWSIWFCVCFIYLLVPHLYAFITEILLPLNIIYLSDKAMLTIRHRILCALSHLYYVCHCIVLCTVCPFLFTLNSQVTLHRSRPVEYRLSFPSFWKWMLVFYMSLQYLTLKILLCLWFMPDI